MRLAGIVVVALVVPAAGCAAPPLVPGKPKSVAAHPLPPYAFHEECFTLDKGDAVAWRFAAQAAIDFNVHYHEGKAVILPVTRERVMADAGRFVALVRHDYCLMWEAKAQGTTLDYTIELTRPPR